MRQALLPPVRVSASGKPVCRWCGKPVPRKRRRWCSEECVEDYRIRAWPGYARTKVWERDRGICASCGINSQAERRRFKRAELKNCSLPAGAHRTAGWPRFDRDWWEADHIVPVERGGGGCDLKNLQTLCYRCHLLKTREQARERRSFNGRKQMPDLSQPITGLYS